MFNELFTFITPKTKTFAVLSTHTTCLGAAQLCYGATQEMSCYLFVYATSGTAHS